MSSEAVGWAIYPLYTHILFAIPPHPQTHMHTSIADAYTFSCLVCGGALVCVLTAWSSLARLGKQRRPLVCTCVCVHKSADDGAQRLPRPAINACLIQRSTLATSSAQCLPRPAINACHVQLRAQRYTFHITALVAAAFVAYSACRSQNNSVRRFSVCRLRALHSSACR